MPLVQRHTNRIWKRHTPRETLLRWIVTTALLLLFFISFRVISANTLWVFVLDAPRQGWDILSRMFPPELPYAGQLWKPLWDTIVIATFGTLGAVIIAFPVAFFGAKNTSPGGGVLRPAALLLIVTSRSINSLAWALMLVTILGPGILAGILAITLRSIGFVSKLLYEAIEEIDYRQVEAVKAAGAHPLQVLRIAILPQIMPAFTSISMYRWDINIRESTVLGLVGAGGIGLQLQASINVLAWRRVAVILLLILGTVVISELITARVRKNLL
ncbi:phosphonate ABC transporter, permease protein PhnE [Salinispira pacifica]|uniref:Phosphonate ABC transporter permease protein phnE1 n=1 Tax=Salinispira pacifica TaxID=1307761 RepID=V5WH90_9SPIO|nr:phosphonate ABC transporter, permease protein PhnE [Salinispira pacifica]AHC14924.1 Phosphonate ABC transporter permease protein phnE1 [Salinispira pacifica]